MKYSGRLVITVIDYNNETVILSFTCPLPPFFSVIFFALFSLSVTSGPASYHGLCNVDEFFPHNIYILNMWLFSFSLQTEI